MYVLYVEYIHTYQQHFQQHLDVRLRRTTSEWVTRRERRRGEAEPPSPSPIAMSADVIRSFFPSIDTLILHHPSISHLWSLLFPPHIHKLCPRPQISLQIAQNLTLNLKWPFASIFCALGILIGFAHARPVLGNALWSRNPKGGSFAWGFAFLWYGLMSVGGLFFHCILTTSTTFYLMDVIATACCSMSIVFAILQMPDKDKKAHWRAFMCGLYGLIFASAIWGTQAIRELLYLVPSLLALFSSALYYISTMCGYGRRPSPSTAFWLNSALASSLVAVVPIILDSKFCIAFGPEFGLLPWFFLGSDLAVPFLYYATLPSKPQSKTP